ncbi:hypothetical protein IGI72_003760 [Enterococcus sp. DIV1059_2]|nr:hypothetical protein A5882_003471 [Enterococcus sp. 4E1_DIV0656]
MAAFLFIGAFFVMIYFALSWGRGGCVTTLFVLFILFIFLVNPFLGLPVIGLTVLISRAFFKD